MCGEYDKSISFLNTEIWCYMNDKNDGVYNQTKQSTLLCNVLLCVHWRIMLYPEPWVIFPTFIFLPLFYANGMLYEATNETLTDVKKRSIPFQRCLKFQKIPIGPGVVTARSCAPQLHSKIVFLLNYLMLIWLAVTRARAH